MRSLLARLAVLGAFAVTLTGCQNGPGTSLPYAGSPNQSGGTPGTIQAGSNGAALIRFVQGSPDYGSVDVCIDQTPFNGTSPTVPYGGTRGLYAIAGGITHTIAVYSTITSSPGSVPGSECATAPGPYFGLAPIAVTTLNVGNNVRWSVVLGGTNASKTFGLYVFTDPTFAAGPAGAETISHNAAPAFSTGKPNGVGFGICTTTATPCAAPVVLPGANAVPPAAVSPPAGGVTRAAVASAIAGPPAGFYDGIGVPSGNPVPITSIPAPAPVAGQPYVVQLYAIDAPAGGLNLVGVVEQTLGFGF